MTMKGINGNPALDAYHRVAVTPVGAARPADPVATPRDPEISQTQAARVSISSTARELAAHKEESLNTDRVQELKQRIAEGNLQVNPQVIASKMLDAIG